VGGQTYTISRTRDLLRCRSDMRSDRWIFSGRRGSVTVRGEAELHPTRVAHARYTTPADTHLWVSNSRFSRLKVEVVDDRLGLTHKLTSQNAAFESGSKYPQHAELHIEG
jgi:hypothetical protein